MTNISAVYSVFVHVLCIFSYVAVTIGKYPNYQGDQFDLHREINRVGLNDFKKLPVD